MGGSAKGEGGGLKLCNAIGIPCISCFVQADGGIGEAKWAGKEGVRFHAEPGGYLAFLTPENGSAQFSVLSSQWTPSTEN